MTWWQAVCLGGVQGLTEFLPISSSGHLILISRLFHIAGHSLAFDVFLHAGTLLAVLAAFRRTFRELVRRPFSRPVGLLLVSTAPTVAVGVLFEDAFAQMFHGGATLGLEFIVTGLLIWFAEARQRETAPGGREITYRGAWWIGVAQGAAIMPALSRSALTLCTALSLGVDRKTAVEYSFVLSAPVILGAVLWESRSQALSGGAGLPLWCGCAASAVTGYLAIRLMLRWVRQRRLGVFAWYTLLLGLAIVAGQILVHRFF